MQGSIRARSPGHWELQVYVGINPATGKRKRHYETVRGSYPAAQKRLRKLLTELDDDVFVPVPRNMTLTNVLNSWLSGYARTNCSQRTYDGYESICRNYLIPNIGAMPLRAVTPAVIQDCYGKIGERLSRRTVNHTHRVLFEALKWAQQQGLIARNPASLTTVKVPRVITMRTLTPAELALLLRTATGSYYYPVIFTAVSSGLRQSELLGLRWRDIDLKLHTISVNRVLYKRGGVVEFKIPKTQNSRRRVDMAPKLAVFLKSYKEERQSIYKDMKKTITLDGLVFESVNFQPLHQATVGHAFADIAVKAGLPGVRFHDLRHTFASLMLLRGAAPKVISEALGHSSVAFTMDTYSHIIEGMQKDAIALLDDVLPDGVITPSSNNGNLTA